MQMTISVPQCVEVITVRCCDGTSPLYIYRGLPCNEVHCMYFCGDSFIVRRTREDLLALFMLL